MKRITPNTFSLWKRQSEKKLFQIDKCLTKYNKIQLNIQPSTLIYPTKWMLIKNLHIICRFLLLIFFFFLDFDFDFFKRRPIGEWTWTKRTSYIFAEPWNICTSKCAHSKNMRSLCDALKLWGRCWIDSHTVGVNITAMVTTFWTFFLFYRKYFFYYLTCYKC